MAISDKDRKRLVEAISGYLACTSRDAVELHWVGSQAVASLEEKLRNYYGKRHALCVSSATMGLLAVAIALDLRSSDFLTSPYTYGASLAGWLLFGNRPIFVDIDPETLTLDPQAARRAITPKTRALLAIDIFGNPSDSLELRKVADEMGLWYVADAAQSFGARRDNSPASLHADALVVSFTVGKPLSAGEGGAILTDNSELFDKLLWFTQHPYRQKRYLGIHLSNEFALNGRIHPLAAIWANTLFESSLKGVKERQKECFRVIDALNKSEITQPIPFAANRIESSFFRLTAAWKSRRKERKLQEVIERIGYSVVLDTQPVQLIYRQASFIAQFAGRLPIEARCPSAEVQRMQRFGISLRPQLREKHRLDSLV